MAKILKTFDLKGILDDFQDFVDTGVQHNGVFADRIKSVPHRTKDFDWTLDVNQSDVDEYSVADAAPEGVDDVGNNYRVPFTNQTTDLNYTQKFTKFVRVSKTAQASSLHGRPEGEAQYQIGRAVVAIENQMERAFLSTQLKRKEVDGGAPRLTDGALQQILPTLRVSGGITAANLQSVADKLFAVGSEADTVLVGKGAAQALIKAFKDGDMEHLQWMYIQPIPRVGNTQKEYLTFVDNQGKLYRVLPTRYMPDGAALFTNYEYWSKVVFRPMTISHLGTKGSYDNFLIECEIGIRNDARLMSALITSSAVAGPATDFSLSVSGDQSLTIGTDVNVTVAALPSGTAIDAGGLILSTSDISIVEPQHTSSTTIRLHPKAAGTATVTIDGAAYGLKTVTLNVTVAAAAAATGGTPAPAAEEPVKTEQLSEAKVARKRATKAKTEE